MCRFCNKPEHREPAVTIANLKADKLTLSSRNVSLLETNAKQVVQIEKDDETIDSLIVTNNGLAIDLASCRIGGQPTLTPPNLSRDIIRDAVYDLIDEISRQTLRYLDDNLYGAVSKEDCELYALWVGAYKMPFIVEEQDCDDYTLKLRSEKVGVPGWRRMPIFDVQYRHPILGPHSEALVVLIEGDGFALYIIEGQQAPDNGRLIADFRPALPYFTNWKPTLIKQ